MLHLVFHVHLSHFHFFSVNAKNFSGPTYTINRGGSRGRVQGVHTPPPPRYDLRFSNTTGILQKKKKLCGLLVLK